MSTNPYAAPKSAVADVAWHHGEDADFIPEAQSVSIGNGLTGSAVGQYR